MLKIARNAASDEPPVGVGPNAVEVVARDADPRTLVHPSPLTPRVGLMLLTRPACPAHDEASQPAVSRMAWNAPTSDTDVTDGEREKWNRPYAESDYVPGSRPTPFLVEWRGGRDRADAAQR